MSSFKRINLFANTGTNRSLFLAEERSSVAAVFGRGARTGLLLVDRGCTETLFSGSD